MITGAFDLGIFTLLFFVLGMFKPKWPLFFMQKPDRFMIIAITTILFMITATLYGEGLRREKLKRRLNNRFLKALLQPLFLCPFLFRQNRWLNKSGLDYFVMQCKMHTF